MNTHTTHLTEADFVRNEERRLKELAGMIRLSGKSAAEIAAACNLDKRTVQRAMRAEPLKSDAQARIEYYIKQLMYNG